MDKDERREEGEREVIGRSGTLGHGSNFATTVFNLKGRNGTIWTAQGSW